MSDSQRLAHRLGADVLALDWNEELRPITLSPLTRASALRISSDMPSEKYSWSCAGLRSSKAITAIEFFGAAIAATGYVAGVVASPLRNEGWP